MLNTEDKNTNLLCCSQLIYVVIKILFNCFISALLPLFWKAFGDVSSFDVLPQRLCYMKTAAFLQICQSNEDSVQILKNKQEGGSDFCSPS